MAVTILMPALSPTMTEGKLARWLKHEGDKVKPGEIIAEIETDKAVMEVEATDAGILAKIIVGDATSGVAVNQVIALLREKNDSDADIAAFIAEHSGGGAVNKSHANNVGKQESDAGAGTAAERVGVSCALEQKADVQAAGGAASEAQGNIDSGDNKRIFASPLARRVAANHGVNLLNIGRGTGPNTRIVKQDVLDFIAHNAVGGALNHGADKLEATQNSGAAGGAVLLNERAMALAAGESRLLPISPMRKVIATRLSESKQQIPHFYIDMACDMTKLVALRQELNSVVNGPQDPSLGAGKASGAAASKAEAGGANGGGAAASGGGVKISVNDLVVRAVALALRDFPVVNTAWSNEGIRQFADVDIAVAVAIADGLVTPVVRQADKLSIAQLSREIKLLVHKANSNSLRAKEIQGGAITISNLGMYGVDSFKAIINPPQASILAVGGIKDVAVVRDGALAIAPVMQLALSCDHRVIDGAVAAKFLGLIRYHLENPLSLLL